MLTGKEVVGIDSSIISIFNNKVRILTIEITQTNKLSLKGETIIRLYKGGKPTIVHKIPENMNLSQYAYRWYVQQALSLIEDIEDITKLDESEYNNLINKLVDLPFLKPENSKELYMIEFTDINHVSHSNRSYEYKFTRIV